MMMGFYTSLSLPFMTVLTVDKSNDSDMNLLWRQGKDVAGTRKALIPGKVGAK